MLAEILDWNDVSIQFAKGMVTTVVVALIFGVLSRLFSIVANLLAKATDFDVRGYWVGSCWLPSYSSEAGIEFWKYTRRGTHLRFVFFAYDGPGEKPKKWRGQGMIRNNSVSAYYWQPSSLSYEAGVLALQVKRLRLQGVYAQFDVKGAEEDLFVGKDYFQVRAPLSFFAKIKMALGYAPFATFEEAKALFEMASARQPA